MNRLEALLSWLNHWQIKLFTWRHGVFVGDDRYGNRYYKRPVDPSRHRHTERRWVIYAGPPEATKVPPEWHGWLHHSMEVPLSGDSAYRRRWQKEHQVNLSGTVEGYLPSDHPLRGAVSVKLTYQPWSPDDA